MRRATIHSIFSIITVSLLAYTLWQAYTLYENRQIISAVVAVPAVLNEVTADVGASPYPHVLLAKASALSAGGQFEAAETLFVKLIDRHQYRPLGQAARFNLANHYLRQGLREDLSGAQVRPLLETAKQRYRDLLRADPQDWDARYNLERALRLAPEDIDDKLANDAPKKSVRVIVPDFRHQDLP